MGIEIRPAREEELDRTHFVVAYAFTGDRSAEGRVGLRHCEEMGPPVVLLADGEIVASLRVYPLSMYISGTPVPLGGVSSVACLPEERRKGYVGQLLRHALGEMREKGQPLSALYTPHPSLYRRFGWMVAGSALKCTWNPKEVRFQNQARSEGRSVRVTEDDWAILDAVYRQYCVDRTGYLERSERWWKEAVFRRFYEPKRELLDVALWRNPGGEATGYTAFSSARGADGRVRVEVREVIALDGDAYRGLIGYILSHDLASEITWHVPVDEPFGLALDDLRPERLKREYLDDFMLRVVDVEKAVAARPAGPGAPEGAFTAAIADASAPWNEGTWRIENSGGRLSTRKVERVGDIAMDAATFAALYDGHLRATDAARAGLADVSNAKAAALADRVLAVERGSYAYGSDFF